ncbi:hypothetical protein [Vibrio alginolyticus]|uniref:hypothetical protein n=1 Tax=Vibrio alginolyticus TaxID=663 RepID=UPI0015F48AC4|nr:hypothetical protein [Vibrio alginolyticus]
MKSVSSETYISYTICGQRLVLEVFGEPSSVSKMTLGNRFFTVVKCLPSNSDNAELVSWFFDYYNNYAPLLEWGELKKGWSCYQKAKKQRSDSFRSAFWNYFDGKRLKLIGRKGSVFVWI